VAFFNGEEWFLVRVYQDTDDYLIEEFATTFNDVQMAVSNRIE
jgi:hypothetical protein